MRDRFADLLLQRAALIARIDRNRTVDPLAGLKVDDEDVERLLAELPGLETGDSASADDIEGALADQIEAARADLIEDLGEEPDFATLVRAAALAPVEIEVLALLCAVEADPRRQRLVGYLNDDVGARRPTIWTLKQLFGAAHPAVLAAGPAGGIRRACLLAPSTEGTWVTNALTLAPSVLWWLAGDRSFDPDLPVGSEVLSGTPGGTETLVLAAGSDRRRRLQAVARSLAADRLLVCQEPPGPDQWDAVIRQATVADLGVVIELTTGLSPAARDRVERAPHLAWALTSTHGLALDEAPRRPWVEATVEPPAATDEEWAAVFPDERVRPYRLTADQLHHVSGASAALGGDLPGAVRRLASGRVDAAASRIRPQRGWDDLVLDGDRLEQVREVARRSRQRNTVFDEWGFSPYPSTGVVALFAGPSGTGKTLAAEVIASDLGVDLYKIDLAHLVSKYIGETEQNLARVFDAAEATNVALFFDEADALLGKRSEVSDAHDRYANIEVAYLLQRLELYQGVAVLATNLAKNIDPTFLRRLHVVVEFPLPQAAERRQIWARCLPPGAPVAADVDLDRLADSFELAGGTIRNAILSAAFLAAEAGTPITMDLTVLALRRELQKIGRLVHEGDFSH